MKTMKTKKLILNSVFKLSIFVGFASAAQAQVQAKEIDWTARDLGGVYRGDEIATRDLVNIGVNKGEVFDTMKLELVKASEKVGEAAATPFIAIEKSRSPKLGDGSVSKRDFYFVRSTPGLDSGWPIFALEVLKIVNGKEKDQPQYKIITYKVDHYMTSKDNTIKNEVFDVIEENDFTQSWVSRQNHKRVTKVKEDFDPKDL